MTTQKTIFISALAVLLLVGLPAQAFVGSIAVGLSRTPEFDDIKQPFSAQAEVETEEGKFRSTMRYEDGKLEDVINMGSQSMRTITRFDRNKSYFLMGQGMYMENEIGQAEQSREYELVEFTEVGREVVNNQDTRKIKTVHQGKDGKFAGFLWLNDDNVAIKGFMVSEEKGEKTRILFNVTDYTPGDQPDEAFELPAGAKPFSMPSFGNMAGMGGQQGTQGMPSNQQMPDFTQMQQMQQVDQAPQSNPGTITSPDVSAEAIMQAGGNPGGAPQDQGLAGDAKEAADQGVEQGVKEGIFQGTKDATKGLINKGFGIFKK